MFASIQYRRTRRGFAGYIAAAAAFAVVIAAGQYAQAQVCTPKQLGPVGLGIGQTARLGVVDLRPPADLRVDEPPEPCEATLEFLDVFGRPVVDRSGEVVRREVLLLPGQAAFLDLPRGAIPQRELLILITPRIVVPPEPVVPPDPIEPSACDGLVGSVQVFNNRTGWTQIAMGTPPDDGIVDFFGPENPMPPALFGMLGLARGQTARLHLLFPPEPIVPPEPIQVIMGFKDEDGRVLRDTEGREFQTEVELVPGVVETFELPAGDIAFDGLRKEFRPFVAFPPEPVLPEAQIVANVELVSNFTGRTQVLVSGFGATTPDDSLE
jgi:hypothetical protein